MLFYGEEIGMGENPDLPGRMAVRAPMQWSDEANAGFSTAPAERLCRPVTELPGDGPGEVNAADQRRRDDSMLNWFERLIRRRRESPELAHGTVRPLEPASPAVFAHRADWGELAIVAAHNLDDAPCGWRSRSTPRG